MNWNKDDYIFWRMHALPGIILLNELVDETSLTPKDSQTMSIEATECA